MNLNQIDIKNFILALFKRDDGERILLGAGAYDFKDSLQHFQANIIANDIIEKQGTDGQLLAGQVRRCQTQTFEGYIGDASTSRIDTEDYRRKFIQFFRTNHFYTVIYIMPNGDAIQRKNGYLVEAPSAPEQYQRFPEYSVGFQFEDLNYYTYSEDDQGEETYAQTVDILPEGNLTGGLVWDGDGVVWDDQGKHIAALKGDTYQLTTTGKNIYNPTAYSTAQQGIRTTIGADGEIHLEGTATTTYANLTDSSTPISMPGGTAYTFSIDKTLPFRINLRTTWSGGYADRSINAGGTKVSFTPANAITSMRIFMTSTSGTHYDESFHAMVEAGSTQTAFEPYTGQAPAPSPDYPEPVQTATGSLTVTIISSKNLFDKNNATIISAYVNNNGDIIAGSDTRIIFIQCESNTTYTVSKTNSGTNQRFCVFDMAEDPAVGAPILHSVGTRSGVDTATSYTITTEPTAKYLGVFFRVSATTPSEADILDTIQIEKGSIPTAYEPYTATDYPLDLGTIELAKLGTSQDRIYKDGEDWKVEKNTDKRTFNGDDTDVEAGGWSNSSQTTTTVQVSTLTIQSLGVKFSERESAKMSHFSYIGDANPVFDGSLALVNNASGVARHIRLGISKTIAANLTAAKAWMAANLPTLYFPAYTSTTTTITDTNLIAQLDAIDEALEAGGTTTVTPAAGNRAAIITTTPSGNGGAVWDASGGHSTNTITVGGLFAVQPVWIIDGPAESPVMENITDGTSLSYIGVIPAGQTLVIDCTNQTAYLDGANVKNNVRGTWQSFSPGEVTIRYSGANVTQASTLKWNEVVG